LVGEHATPAAHATHAPASQTSPAPQLVPFATLPDTLHTGVPPEQSVVPVWHGLPGEQAVPVTHAPHVPLSQTWPAPQLVPSTTLPVALHTATPVEQLVVPVWHGLVGEQEVPAVHATHDPASQTRPVPHEVPLLTAWVVLPQTGTPVEQTMAPVTQGLGGVLHTAPAVQAEHTPLSQTALVPHEVPLAAVWAVLLQTGEPVAQPMAPRTQGLGWVVQAPPGTHVSHTPPTQKELVPHGVPFVAGLPVSLHSTVPVWQLVAPVWQTSIGVQPRPAAQATQEPTSQTRLVPHDVPLATLPDAAQTGAPLEQSMTPISHCADGVQVAPDAHALQDPSSQTRPAPHPVPLGPGVPVSSHTGVPLEQLRAPLSHTLVGVHALPDAQAVHAPFSQTMLVPHEVPLAASPMSTQTTTPVEQSVVPMWHGLVGVQAVPAVHATQEPSSHTSFVPQAVPLAAKVPVSAH
jgi:hypothetical protein